MAAHCRLTILFPQHVPANCGAFVEIRELAAMPLILLAYFGWRHELLARVLDGVEDL